MRHVIVLGITVCLVAVGASLVRGEVVTLDGTVKAVDAKKRTITVATGAKTLTLDVSSKAKISVEGKDATLDTLKPGQKVKLAYHKDLEIVLKVEVLMTESSTITGEEISLFNGHDLNGWHLITNKNSNSQTNEKWIADPERKVLVCLGGDLNDLATNDDYGDFKLFLEWRFAPGQKLGPNGSGIIVRSNGRLNGWGLDPQGVEIDIRPNKDKSRGIGVGTFIRYDSPLQTRRGHVKGMDRVFGWVREPEIKSVGQWNATEIVCDGDRITVKVNGSLVNEGTALSTTPGKIVLRNQNTPIEFRNIRLVLVPSRETTK